MPRGYSVNNQKSGRTITERLEYYSDRTGGADGCWPWTGAISSGYGSLKIDGVTHRAHKVAWEQRNGPVPAGLLLRHRCDNPPCINPNHMQLGTDADNAADKVARQRSARGERNAKAALTAMAILEIRASSEPRAVLAKRFDTTVYNISKILRGVTWRHLLPEGKKARDEKADGP